MKTYEATVRLEFVHTGIEAENIKDFVAILKDSFYETYGLELSDNEILKIREVKNDDSM